MASRRGLSLSVKMILTTTLLIVVTVVGSGVLNVINIRRVFDETTQRQIDLFRKDREQLGALGAPLFARAIESMLIDRGKDEDILKVTRLTVGGDTQGSDYGLRFAIVLDLNQAVIVQCVEGAQLECTPEEKVRELRHEPVTPALGPVIADAWTAALVEWKRAAAGSGLPLAAFDLATGGARYRVFALPVFVGENATAAGAIRPAKTNDTRFGYVVLGYDLAPLDAYLTTASQEKTGASTRAALYTGAVGALFALIGTVLAILQGLSISRPIKALAWKADQIARGDLEARVEVSSGDEIGFLGENFNFMADQILILLQQTAEKAQIEQELEVAKAIQETLVPGPEPVRHGALTFAGFYQPAAQTGGDWWTWSELRGDKVMIVIGDVTGHGVPSAMITAAAKAACDVARFVYDDDVAVSRLLEIMNHAIFESAQRRFVMTCFASVVDTRQRTITYANAGHNFPYLFRVADGKGEFGSLMIRGNRLGDDPSSKYEAKTTPLVPGDVLVWYTDGIVECENEEGEEYGEKRFRASVRKAAALDAGEMRDAIVGDATTFFAEMPRKDDITMVIGRLH